MTNKSIGTRQNGDDFYVGYLPIPAGTKRLVVAVVAFLFVVMIGSAAIISTQQSSSGGGNWEFGVVRDFEGRVVAQPYPMIIGPHPDGSSAGIVTYIVVSEGKHGSRERMRPFDGDYVRLKASLLDRNGRYLIELASDDNAIEKIESPSNAISPHTVGTIADATRTLAGEIIDPKCYIGAMKPGGGRTHRACATLCIRGGIPPMFVTRDAELNETFYLLTDAQGGEILEPLIPFIGEPVKIAGQLDRLGDLNIFRVQPDGISRIGSEYR